MKKGIKYFGSLVVVVLAICMTTTGAYAAEPMNGSEGLGIFLEAVSSKSGVDNNLFEMIDAGILEDYEAGFIMQYNCVTPSFAWSIALPLYDIFPYPAEVYTEITTDGNCVGTYRDARAAAISLGLATEEEDANRVMSVEEVQALFDVLDAGLELPKVETGCKYVDEVDHWTAET